VAPNVDTQLLELLIRRAMQRGIPAEDAEDIVLRAYHKATVHFDPEKGSFEALYLRIVDNDCRYFWRTWQRRKRRDLRLLNEPGIRPGSRAEERAAANQRRLLEALDPDERRIFATWALQRHLPRGRLRADDAARSLGITVADWENAKRRLKKKIARTLDEWGLEPRDLFSVEDDERPKQYAS